MRNLVLFLGATFLLSSAIAAGYSGYTKLPWYLIFIYSIIMSVGYYMFRAPQIRVIAIRYGVRALSMLFVSQIIIYSVITASIYFIATLLN